MKAGIIHYRIVLLFTVVFAFSAGAFAQGTSPSETQPQPTPNQPQDARNNALRQLGLSPDQVQQIRRVNMARKPLMDEAQKRFREANRLLDEAIYADQVNESDVQARLKDVQLAQAEVAKIRFMNELTVRRILTPDQLVRFRALRQQFEQARENIDTRRSMKREERRIDRQNSGNGGPLREFKQKERPAAKPNQQP